MFDNDNIRNSIKYSGYLFENDLVPCYFLYGLSDSPAFKSYYRGFVHELEEHLKIPFKGIVKHFLIRMPYMESAREISFFVEKFREAISIARDCYNEYRGIVIIEISSLWLENGINSNFSCLSSLIHEYKNNCYIVTAAGKIKDSVKNDITNTLKESAILIEIKSHVKESQNLSEIFASTAADMGYVITSDAKTMIEKYLSEVCKYSGDIRQLIIQNLFQIDMTKKLSHSEKIITEADIAALPKRSEFNPGKNIIGFGPYIS